MSGPVDAQVIFTPSGRRGQVAQGTTVLDAARRLGVDIDSVCGGRGICGRCAVTPAFGSFAKHGITSAPEHLSEAGEVEADYRAEHRLAADRRLSCTAMLLGDAVIDVPPESQVHRQVVRKDLDARPFVLDPVIRLHTVDVTEPDLATPTGDLGRLFDALASEWQLTGLRADLAVIRALQPALTAGDYRVTVAIHGGRDVIAVWPGFHDRAFGVAIDVGSTTIAGHLANLTDGTILASAGVMNPQIRFGEDLMSRVSYVMMHEGGDVELTTRGPKGARRPARDPRQQGGHQARRDPRARDRRQPDHASPPAGHRPDAARFGALCPRHRYGGRADRRGTRGACPSGRPGLRPAVHRGTRRRGHRGRDPGRGTAQGGGDDPRRGRGHERGDRAGRPASTAGRQLTDRPSFRGRPDQRRPARRARRHRARARRPRHAGASVPRDRRGCVVGRPWLRGGAGHGRDRRHRHLRLGHHRGRGRALPCLGRDAPTASSMAAWRVARRASSPMAGPSATSCTSRPTADRASWSPRTTSGRSSWPRLRSTPGFAC
ncbi:MAG: 2Fe-2S iron-sulfur cluster-binding protein [Candidatus Limnocylindrales bacterium]